MNKEEAIKKLAEIIFDVSELGDIPYDTEDEQCAMNIARRRIDELFPTLPDNLDEAAEEYRDTEVCTGSDYIDDDGDSLYRSFALKEAFKEGAEWMAGQGVTVNGSIEEISDGVYKTIDIFAQELDDVWTDGDCEVIIQIRKK